tara:strand:- start:291 stop:509 length:219 start_codon:yes stop_codon:yes gene_type:complete
MKVGDMVKCNGIGIGIVLDMHVAESGRYGEGPKSVATVHWFVKDAFASDEGVCQEDLQYLEVISEARCNMKN